MTHQPTPYGTTPAEAAAMLLGASAVAMTIWAIAGHWPTWVTLLIAAITAPLAGIATFAALGRINRGGRRRLRPRYLTVPRPAVVLTDTPRPGCRTCAGDGGWIEYHRDGGPEDGIAVDVPCDCWTTWHRTLLPIPRTLAQLLTRRGRAAGSYYSQEPPF
jgi:hypothetical protein